MRYDRLNIITGWTVWAVATIVYMLTVEPTASFWDCGEFIASAYKLEVGHPPGAPLFMLLARGLMVFATPEWAAFAANSLSALSSSFTILFLFWSITHLARRFSGGFTKEPTSAERWAILGSGVVGALAYTFSDSFWFSATEGEVYALSSLFTAAVFWAILKWENEADEPGATRWIILIAYLMGLSIGVHLLNLLAIPAMALVYYFRKYEFSWKGLVITGVASIALLGFIQIGLIQGVIKLAGDFERFFVNSMGLPFNSGIFAYLILLIALITALVMYSRKRGWWALNTFVLSIAMVLIGYSSFTTIVVRSSANPPMDENDPENFFQLLKYLNREQYGDRPLVTGPYWDSPMDIEKQYSDGGATWVKSFSVKEQKGTRDVRVKSFKGEVTALNFLSESKNDKYRVVEEYINTGEKKGTVSNYDSDYTMLFPRMYSSDSRHVKEYRIWSNYKGYNEASRYTSPLVDEEMSQSGFMLHLQKDILSGNLSEAVLGRTLKRLFADYGQRWDGEFEIRSKNEILVRDPQTGGMRLAPLDDPRAVDALTQMITDRLAQGLDRGKGFVKRLNQEKRSYESTAARAKDYTEQQQALASLDKVYDELQPTLGENLRYFMDYQVGWMYLRYFMWNFAGKQNDSQGHGDFQSGNWLSGVDAIDALRIGSRDTLTQEMSENKGLNKFFYLPLLLGLIGLIFQIARDPRGAGTVGLLFFMTGLAIVVYLNQTPMQPRERDYAYVGSFYAFAMWIGISVFALFDAARRSDWMIHLRGLGFPLGVGVVFYFLEHLGGTPHYLSLSILFMTFCGAVLYGIAHASRLMGLNENGRALALVGMTLLVPILMASEGWDDHNRSHRTTGVDFAKNYLESLAPNAILFTNGDNDTFPLWYAQEVEGVRTDVRVCNLSLLNTDWYIDQMKRRAYESAPLPIKMSEEQYRQGTRDIVLLEPTSSPGFVDLKEALRTALDDDIQKSYGEKSYPYFPTNKFSLPVDSARVIELGIVNADEASTVVDALEWTVVDGNGDPLQYILKNQLAVLSMLANNNWERPVYFAVTTGGDSYIGLQDYFRLEGLAYRLVPIKYGDNPNPNLMGGIESDLMYKNVMENWSWGGMDDLEHGIYMDENNRRMVTNVRLQMANLADALIEVNDPQRALEVLDKLLLVTPPENVPYTRVLMPVVEAYAELASSDTLLSPNASRLSEDQRKSSLDKAQELLQALFKQQEELVEFALSLDAEYFTAMTSEIDLAIQVNDRLIRVYKYYHPEDPIVDELDARLGVMEDQIEGYERSIVELGFMEF
ncbi:MAG: DUF2723 domain-containing protein [Bacteroidetes bacterium]|nr:DUF2723 domain-containing protein [Bacteroidota bacterium]